MRVMRVMNEEEFCEEMELNAMQEDKDSAIALDIAFADFQRRRRREELEAFEYHRKSIIASIDGSRTDGSSDSKETLPRFPRSRRPTPLPLPPPDEVSAHAETGVDLARNGDGSPFATLPSLSNLSPIKDD